MVLNQHPPRSANNSRRSVLLTTLALLGLALTCGHASADGPYRGRVIDAETKEPLVGAVVLIYWNRHAPGIGHGPLESFLGAEETLTDDRGAFVVARNPPQTWIPGTWRSTPYMTIFLPGYAYFPRYYKTDPPSPGRFAGLLKIMEDREVTFELPRLKTREERLKATDTVNPLVVPPDLMPHFVHLLNEELKQLNLPPVYRKNFDWRNRK